MERLDDERIVRHCHGEDDLHFISGTILISFGIVPKQEMR